MLLSTKLFILFFLFSFLLFSYGFLKKSDGENPMLGKENCKILGFLFMFMCLVGIFAKIL